MQITWPTRPQIYTPTSISPRSAQCPEDTMTLAVMRVIKQSDGLPYTERMSAIETEVRKQLREAFNEAVEQMSYQPI